MYRPAEDIDRKKPKFGRRRHIVALAGLGRAALWHLRHAAKGPRESGLQLGRVGESERS
jgi:hypothetical protein